MPQPALGLDFGTTNSALALALPGEAPRCARFAGPDGATPTFRSLLYFDREDARAPVEVHAGPAALVASLEREVHAGRLHAYGKTATFMPKPLVGDNGSGMHVHQSLGKDGKNLFAGDKYAGLSDLALYYIGRIVKHARALNAICNPTTNSYKRLVPGFEAPVMLAYSARNRSASIRIPWVSSPKGRRIEVRFPDPMANPYLALSAMMMAGLDGIQNKIHPGDAMDKDLYDLEPEEAKSIPTVCHALDMALDYLDKDRAFLTAGGVFTDDLIDAYIALKMDEVTRMRMTTHPIEYDMYYSLTLTFSPFTPSRKGVIRAHLVNASTVATGLCYFDTLNVRT